MLSEVGLLGLIPFLIVLIYLFRYSIALYRNLGQDGFINTDLVVAFWAVVVCYLVSAFFIQTQYFLVGNSIVFLWGGIIMGLHQRRLREITGAG
jgi:O-antigen ligase